MNLKDFESYCLAKKGTDMDFPFDDKTMVFRVGDKMFALTSIENKNLKVNLKCNPELALEFRREYEGVKPGYHMNKKHWNTVEFNKDIPKEKFLWMVDHSYDLVFSKLKKSEREKIEEGV